MTKAVQIEDGRKLGIRSAYELLAGRKPGLIVDVGAAQGEMVLAARRHSPSSPVLAFEPFAGNWGLFEERTRHLSGVRLVKAAVADVPGRLPFRLPASADARGYSAVGYLEPPFTPRSLVRDALQRAGLRPRETVVEVAVTTLDQEISEEVLMLKVDVQGGEFGVLQGAKACFDRGIGIVQVEFGGDMRVLNFLAERGYRLYDQPFQVSLQHGEANLSAWEVDRRVTLSNGVAAFVGRPRVPISDGRALSEFLTQQSRRLGWAQTDILALSPEFA